MFVVNAKGSGINHKAGAWSFTVNASVYTFSAIDKERIEGLQELSEVLADGLVDEFGLHNPTYTTIGSATDLISSSEDCRGQGIYFVHLDVEDITVAKGDYRLRQHISTINDSMLAESLQPSTYSLVGCTLIPRVSSKLRLHISEAIRELIREGLKRFFASVVRR